MKVILYLAEIALVLGMSVAGVSAITAILCLVCKVDFSMGKALVIWVIWFLMNIARRKLSEKEAKTT